MAKGTIPTQPVPANPSTTNPGGNSGVISSAAIGQCANSRLCHRCVITQGRFGIAHGLSAESVITSLMDSFHYATQVAWPASKRSSTVRLLASYLLFRQISTKSFELPRANCPDLSVQIGRITSWNGKCKISAEISQRQQIASPSVALCFAAGDGPGSKHVLESAMNVWPELRRCVVNGSVAQIKSGARYAIADPAVLLRVVKVRNGRSNYSPR